jgi:hypothetical protein
MMPAIFTATSGDDVTVTCTTREVALTGEATATSNNMSRAIAIDGISAMLALQPIGRWNDAHRARRKVDALVRATGVLVPDVIRPFDRTRLERSCMFLRFAEL